MNIEQVIESLKVRIEHNQKEFGECERLHGAVVAKDPSIWNTVHSEMRDWHAGKLEAYKQVLEMLGETQ